MNIKVKSNKSGEAEGRNYKKGGEGREEESTTQTLRTNQIYYWFQTGGLSGLRSKPQMWLLEIVLEIELLTFNLKKDVFYGEESWRARPLWQERRKLQKLAIP